MFTGIIQAIGKVVKYDGNRVWVRAPFRGIRLGESVSVDGVCLTVAAKKKNVLGFDLGRQTQRITTLGDLSEGAKVNLERALRVGDRLGGHWVSGHVEDTGHVSAIKRARQSWWVTLRLPASILKYVIAKGSLAVDGISLTVAAKRGALVDIMIIPHTLSHTTLGGKAPGQRVNIEPDLLAKYAEARLKG